MEPAGRLGVQHPMKTCRAAFIPLLSSLLLTGCVDSGPNTQRGAVAGGALGALGGAIIGNNSGHRNAGQGALIGGLLGAIAGGTLGNSADHEHGTVYRSREEATTTYIVQQPPPLPPPPQVVVVAPPPPPAPNLVWVEGHYAMTPRREYVWIPPHYENLPPRVSQYMAPHWERTDRGSVWVEGYWN